MKKMFNLFFFTAISLASVTANAINGSVIVQTPEIDAASATLAISLVSGIIALMAERRRK